jgi:hypothetical protein
MKYHQILGEAPIEDFNLVGDWNKSSSFRHETDRKLLTNPKAQAKIIHKWANTAVPFSMNFVNFPGAGKFLEQGEVDREWLEQNMPKVLPQLKLSDDAVNIIFTNNTGAERVPMTAWIIAHRFGHALQRFGKNTLYRNYRDTLGRGFDSILERAYNLRKPRSYIYGEQSYIDNQNFESAVLAFMSAIGTFKSARDNNLRNDAEFFHEVLAQYLLTGGVRFNPAPRSLDYGRKAWGRATRYARLDPAMTDYANNSLATLAGNATSMCEEIMHSAVGHIYVM